MTGPEIVYVIERTLAERGISKGEFYAACNVTAAMMSNWRRGKNLPLMDTMARINRFLGTDLILTSQKLTLPPIPQRRPMSPGLQLKPTRPQLSAEDREIAEYLQEIRDDPNKRMMFDLAKDATIEEIKATVAFLELLKGKRTEE